jgi:lipopolysaccharide transport system permease protein
LIAKIWLPKVIFPLAKVQEILYKQVVVFALLLVYVSLEGRAPSFNWLWLLPLVIVEYLIIVACAIAGALLVCLAQDFQRLIQLGTLFLLFASGIFWDVRSIPSPEIQSNVLTFNPVAFLLDGYRQVLMWGGAPDVMHLLLLGLVAALACAGLIWWSSRLEQWLALRVLSL